MHIRHLRTGCTARLLVVAAGAVAVLALAGSATSAGLYRDATGDSGSAPDITGAIVTSAGGQLVFTVSLTSLASVGNSQTQLFVDSDANPSTGNPDLVGTDYVFVDDPAKQAWYFGHWTGSDWDWETPWSTVTLLRLASTLVITVNRSELSNTNQLNLWARTVLRGGSAGDVDVAPDAGVWNYDLPSDGPDIRGVVTATKPAAGPRAGKPFTVTVTGLQLPPDGESTPAVPRPDKYSCAAKLAGRKLNGRGTGGCTFALPKNARGKRLVVAVTVQYEGATKIVQLPYRIG
jgi:hypothetical protein